MPKKLDGYHHGNLKAALLKAAFYVIGKTGIEGFTLREIARRAGVSHNAPYRHFKSKEDLIASLATESLVALNQSVREAVAAEPRPEARLGGAARAYLHFALKNPARFNLTFHGAFNRESYPEYVAAYTDSFALLTQLLEAHTVSHSDADLPSELIWAGLHGIAELGLAKRLRYGDRAQLETLVDAYVETMLRGFGERA